MGEVLGILPMSNQLIDMLLHTSYRILDPSKKSNDNDEPYADYISNHKLPRHGGRYNQKQGYQEFHLKVDIPSFSNNLNIEDFMASKASIDRFFKYMKILEEWVSLVAYILKGEASTW